MFRILAWVLIIVGLSDGVVKVVNASASRTVTVEAKQPSKSITRSGTLTESPTVSRSHGSMTATSSAPLAPARMDALEPRGTQREGRLFVQLDGAKLRSEVAQDRRIVVGFIGAQLVPRPDLALFTLRDCIEVESVFLPESGGSVYWFDSVRIDALPRVEGVNQRIAITFPRLNEAYNGLQYPFPLAGEVDGSLNITFNATCFAPQVRRMLPSFQLAVTVTPPMLPRSVPAATSDGFGLALLFVSLSASLVHGYTILALSTALQSMAVLQANECNLRSLRNDPAAALAPAEAPLLLSLTPYANLRFARDDPAWLPVGAMIGNTVVWLVIVALAAAVLRLHTTRHGWFISNSTAWLYLPGVLSPLGLWINAATTALAIQVFQTSNSGEEGAAGMGASVAAAVLLLFVSASTWPMVIGTSVSLLVRSARWYFYDESAVEAAETIAEFRRRTARHDSLAYGDPTVAAKVVATQRTARAPTVTFDSLHDSLRLEQNNATRPHEGPLLSASSLIVMQAPEEEDTDNADDSWPGSESDGIRPRGSLSKNALPSLLTVPDESEPDFGGRPARDERVLETNPCEAFFLGDGFWEDHCFDFASAAQAERSRVMRSSLKIPGGKRLAAEDAAAAVIPQNATIWRCGFTRRFRHVIRGYQRSTSACAAIIVDYLLLVLSLCVSYGWRPRVDECQNSTYAVLTVTLLRLLFTVGLRPYRTPHANTWASFLATLQVGAAAFGAVYHNSERVDVFMSAQSSVESRPTAFWALRACGVFAVVAMACGIVLNIALAIVAVGERMRQAHVCSAVGECNTLFYDALWCARERREEALKTQEAEMRRAKLERYEVRRARRMAEEQASRVREEEMRQRVQRLEASAIVEHRAEKALDDADRGAGLRPPATSRKKVRLLSVLDGGDESVPDPTAQDEALRQWRSQREADAALAAWGLQGKTAAATPTPPPNPLSKAAPLQRGSPSVPLIEPPVVAPITRLEYEDFDAAFDRAMQRATYDDL
jgi:hypothetical protein